MNPSRPLALTGRLFDGEILHPPTTVLMQGGRVAAIGTALDLPPGTEVLDAGPAGTILPGLIDLHVHCRPAYAAWFPEAGVTTVRDAGNSLDTVQALRTRADLGTGPRLWASGTILDGASSVFQHFGEGVLTDVGNPQAGAWILRTPDDARAAVDLLAEAGVDTIKLYEQLPPDAYRAAVLRAREHGLPVMTDLGTRWTRGLDGAQVDALQALEMGVQTIEHATGFALAFQRLGFDPVTQFPDEDVLLSFARAVVEAGAVLVPTLSVHEGLRSAARQDLAGLPHGTRDDEQARSLRGQWDGLSRIAAAKRGEAEWDGRLAMALTRLVLDLGGQVGAGTDTPAGVDNLPGGGLHAELSHLVHWAQLTPLQALQAATGTAGRVLAGRGPQVGVLRPGAAADAVIVDGNPLEDITVTRRITSVILAGRPTAPSPAPAN